MTLNTADDRIQAGKRLREEIEAHKSKTGESYRSLSKKIGRDNNYIASFMAQEPSSWALPKFPTMEFLLDAIGIKGSDLLKDRASK